MSSSEVAANRIDVLSKPKTVPPDFLEDRRSVYWIDYQPVKPGPNGTTTIEVSERVEELSKSKNTHQKYVYHRPSPMWEVKPSALSANASGRIEQLSQHKTYYEHKIERSPHTTVTDNAKSARISQRLEGLSNPKPRIDRFEVKETHWGQNQPVSSAAKSAKITQRVDTLAEAKPYHEDFQQAKPVMWEVSDLAMKALASLRLQQLSRPRSRTMIKDDHDPYEVSRGARKAKPTPRIEELSAPIPRKTSIKKTV